MKRVDAFITEHLADLVDALHPANHQLLSSQVTSGYKTPKRRPHATHYLQIKFRGDAEVKLAAEGIAVGGEGPGQSSATR